MATVTRNNSDILQGTVLMLFVAGEPIAFATSNSLNFTTNTTEVSTKDHGLFPSVIAQSISWEATAENLACGENIDQLMGILEKAKNNETVHLKFAKPTNWDDKGIANRGSQGNWAASGTLADANHPLTGTQTATVLPSMTNIIAEGDALLTSFSINAPSGDNTTLSATFSGIGAINTCQTAPAGTQGN